MPQDRGKLFLGFLQVFGTMLLYSANGILQ